MRRAFSTGQGLTRGSATARGAAAGRTSSNHQRRGRNRASAHCGHFGSEPLRCDPEGHSSGSEGDRSGGRTRIRGAACRADRTSFETIIASGTRSALPHGRASEAAIPASGFVACDFGVILAGYCSDMTRTVHIGRPGPEMRRIYEAVGDAQQAALETVRAGVTVGAVDRSARKVLHSKGLAKHFRHSTGHGVGLQIHEAPRLGAGQSDVLQAGMVITIEPWSAHLPESGVFASKTW